ncbi:MAG: hypothetical protein ABEI52_07950, partial [Halobacteriaceae archaeon]
MERIASVAAEYRENCSLALVLLEMSAKRAESKGKRKLTSEVVNEVIETLACQPEVIPIKELNSIALILGTTVVGLAIMIPSVQNPIQRLMVSDIAVFLTVLFFYVLLREDVQSLREQIEDYHKPDSDKPQENGSEWY